MMHLTAVHMNPDYLPPGIAIPLALLAWAVYVIVVAVQNSRDGMYPETFEELLALEGLDDPKPHDSETGASQ